MQQQGADEKLSCSLLLGCTTSEAEAEEKPNWPVKGGEDGPRCYFTNKQFPVYLAGNLEGKNRPSPNNPFPG